MDVNRRNQVLAFTLPKGEERRGSEMPHHAGFSEKLFSIIWSSYAIQKHLEFYNWLQTRVTEVLPHDVMLACWGDFSQDKSNRNLKYDVASNIEGINTKTLFDSPEKMDNFMQCLHKVWVENNRRWLVIDHLKEYNIASCLHEDFPILPGELNSLMIYGVSDVRSGENCLYVFFSKENVIKAPDSVMGLLMPHIDNVLRKIQHVIPAPVPEVAKTPCPTDCADDCLDGCFKLSSRETEIMHWVRLGKTDKEIAMILYISENTVKSHLKHVFEKLKVTKRAQAIGKLSQNLLSNAYLAITYTMHEFAGFFYRFDYLVGFA